MLTVTASQFKIMRTVFIFLVLVVGASYVNHYFDMQSGDKIDTVVKKSTALKNQSKL